MLPAIERIPADMGNLIATKSYFVLHAPRQSGKTTAIMSLVDRINEENKYYALYCSFESLERFTDPNKVLPWITLTVIQNMQISGIKELKDACKDIQLFNPKNPDGLTDDGKIADAVSVSLTNSISSPMQSICAKLDKPLLVFMDEIDTLSGDVLVSCLRQLRNGYVLRSKIPFPNTIALVGLCNIRDYKAQIRLDSESLGTSSPFNIIKKAFTLANFSREDVRTLYGQHTGETGQAF
ncbi:MAG: AAA-like domain-containing protein, partial [Deltaproteobacteria bacterium]|nr:AAA-like domain-containing protein [Deltaproteobacteria bacterium]